MAIVTEEKYRVGKTVGMVGAVPDKRVVTDAKAGDRLEIPAIFAGSRTVLEAKVRAVLPAGHADPGIVIADWPSQKTLHINTMTEIIKECSAE